MSVEELQLTALDFPESPMLLAVAKLNHRSIAKAIGQQKIGVTLT